MHKYNFISFVMQKISWTPSSDNFVFPSSLDQNWFISIIESLIFLKSLFIDRKDYNQKKWNILEKIWKNKFDDEYNLYLPIGMKHWECIELILMLHEKFNISHLQGKNISHRQGIQDILSDIKILIWVILKSSWEENGQKYLDKLQEKYSISRELLEKIKATPNPSQKEIKHFLERIKIPIWSGYQRIEDHIKENIWVELNKALFRKSMTTLWKTMPTFTQENQETMPQANSDEWEVVRIHVASDQLDKNERLLREKIGVDTLKSELDALRLQWDNDVLVEAEKNAANKVISILHEYPYQFRVNSFWDKVVKILEHKGVFCVWYTFLSHSLLSELWIQQEWLNAIWHSWFKIFIWDSSYIFDPWKFDKIHKMNKGKKVWSYNQLSVNLGYYTGRIVGQSWDIEDISLWHIYSNKWADLLYEEKYEEAINMYEKALIFNPDSLETHWGMWCALLQLERYKEAEQKFKQCVQIYPESIWVYEYLKEVLEKLEENDGIKRSKLGINTKILQLKIKQTVNFKI